MEAVDSIRSCALVLAFVLLASGCGGGSTSVELETSQEEVAALEAQATTVAPTMTVASTTSAATTTSAVPTGLTVICTLD